MRSHETDLAVHSEAVDFKAVVAHPVLKEAGFSPEFPAILGRLSEVVTPRRISRIGIELFPGEQAVVTTSVDHDTSPGYKIGLEIYPQSYEAEIALLGKGTPFALEDVQAFAKDAFPRVDVRYQAKAADNLEEPIEDFDMPLRRVREKMLLAWQEDRLVARSETSVYGRATERPYGSESKVVIPGQTEPLMDISHMAYRPGIVALQLGASYSYQDRRPAFFFSGRIPDVERVAKALAELFTKPNPYSKPPKA